MNYLILTPDGVGSTLLQRALTVYLNASGCDYYNTHELLTGLEISESNNVLVKNFNIGYNQSLDEIKKLLEKNSVPIVSRLADYHVYRRLEEKIENYVDFYKFCNQYFDKIIYCVRDPYEYALSWAIRKHSNALNVYSLTERNCIHNYNIKYDIDLEYFKKKLNQYVQYQYWVSDHFSNTIPISYDDLNKNIDSTIRKLTNLNFSIENSEFGIGLDQYSKLLYNISLKQQGLIDKVNISKKHLKGIVLLSRYQKKLIKDEKLFTNIPIKMNTLNDKKNRVKNFSKTVETYNSWAVHSNQYKTISNDELITRIQTETNLYDT